MFFLDIYLFAGKKKKKKGPIRPRIWDPEMTAFKIYGKL